MLMVGRTRYTLPLPDWLARKFDALERQLDYRVLASAEEGSPIADERFRLRPAEPSAPARRRALLPALSVPRPPPDQGVPAGGDHRREPVHGCGRDRRRAGSCAARSRGSSSRCTATGGRRRGCTARRAAQAAQPARRRGQPLRGAPQRRRAGALPLHGVARRGRARHPGDGVVRGLHGPLRLHRGAAVQPLPERPTALFVGMLEAYKNIDGLAAAWRRVAPDLPEARLVIVGKGARREVVEQLVADLPGPGRVASSRSRPPRWRRRWTRRRCSCCRRARRGSAASSSRCSRAAAASSRAASAASPTSRATARRRCSSSRATSTRSPLRCVRVLSDRELAERLGEAAHGRYRSWHTTPAEYAARVRSLVDASLRVGGRARASGRACCSSPRAARTGQRCEALREEIDLHVLDRAGSCCPFRVLRAVRRFRPAASSPSRRTSASSCSWRSPSSAQPAVGDRGDARGLARRDAALGGSRGRLLLAPVADRIARYALRRADALRALSPYTAAAGRARSRGAAARVLPGLLDLSAFVERPPQPLPEIPTALYVGMLERTKGIATLADAWPLVADRAAGRAARHRRPGRAGRPRRPPPRRLSGQRRPPRAAAPLRGRGRHGRGDLPRPPVAQRGASARDPRELRPRPRRRREPRRRRRRRRRGRRVGLPRRESATRTRSPTR